MLSYAISGDVGRSARVSAPRLGSALLAATSGHREPDRERKRENVRVRFCSREREPLADRAVNRTVFYFFFFFFFLLFVFGRSRKERKRKIEGVRG